MKDDVCILSAARADLNARLPCRSAMRASSTYARPALFKCTLFGSRSKRSSTQFRFELCEVPRDHRLTDAHFLSRHSEIQIFRNCDGRLHILGSLCAIHNPARLLLDACGMGRKWLLRQAAWYVELPGNALRVLCHTWQTLGLNCVLLKDRAIPSPDAMSFRRSHRECDRVCLPRNESF